MSAAALNRALGLFGLTLVQFQATADTWIGSARHVHCVGKPKWRIERR